MHSAGSLAESRECLAQQRESVIIPETTWSGDTLFTCGKARSKDEEPAKAQVAPATSSANASPVSSAAVKE